MDAVPPFDQIGVSPPGPWQNANPDLGIEGSIPNAVFFSATQTEILNVQDEASLPRNGADYTQLLQALRSGRLNFFADTGSADALVISPRTAFTDLARAEFAILKGAAANVTTTPTLSVSGLVRQFVKEDGSALAAGDLPAGCLLKVRYDGNKFRLLGLRKSDVAVTGSGAATFAQTLITNYPSIAPPRNSLVKKTAGTFTFVVGTDCPANVTELYVTVVGGGGSGAGGGGPTCTWSGGGGGSGGYAADWLAVTNGQSFTGIVGAGGTPSGTGNGNQGSGGGTSSFGPTLQATGGGAAIGGTTTCTGGNAGQGSGSSLGLNFPGANGGDGNPSSLTTQGGAGASSAYGGGGRTSSLNVASVINGLAPGSGGGSIWQNNGSAQLGGTGAAGLVLIQW